MLSNFKIVDDRFQSFGRDLVARKREVIQMPASRAA
jgi:hypothetical protein